MSANNELVRAITHQPFKLEASHLHQRCKRPWLTSPCFVGRLTLINWSLKSKCIPFWYCPRDKSAPIEVSIFKFGPTKYLSTVNAPIHLGLDWLWSPASFLILNLLFFLINVASLLRWLVCIYWDHRQWVVHIPHGNAHIRILLCTRTASHHGPWDGLILYLGRTIQAQWTVDSAIGNGQYKFL